MRVIPQRKAVWRCAFINASKQEENPSSRGEGRHAKALQSLNKSGLNAVPERHGSNKIMDRLVNGKIYSNCNKNAKKSDDNAHSLG
jgi:hypothetical protein